MPWTFAHPAAVLPLRPWIGPQRWSFGALTIGCLSPDLVYHLGLFGLAALTHSLTGIFLICVPAGLFLLTLARCLKEPVAQLLPQPHRQALLALEPVRHAFGFRALAFSATGLAFGALTHIVWDAFTHEGRFFMQHVELLRVPLFQAFGREFHVFKVLQHLSTVVGCALLVHAYCRYLRHLPSSGGLQGSAVEERARYQVLAGIALASTVCALPFALMDAARADARLWLSTLLVRELIYSTTAFFALLAIVAVWRRKNVLA